jgi:heavy metal sensor kinase
MLKGKISISLRLTIWFGGIFLAGWVLFGMSMWLNLKSTLKNERRQTLSRRLDRLQELLVKNQTAAANNRFQNFTDFAHATGNGLAEVLYPNGTRAYPSPSAAAAAFPWPTLQPEDAYLFETVQSAGQLYWVMSRQVDLRGQSVVLLAAAPEAGNLLVLGAFVSALLASAPILLLVSSAGGYWVSRRALMPVDQITATARSISIGNISERIPVTQTGDELQRLTETCNSMFDRLESSVNQIKRFTADASHELRGPLSFTRTVAEIALRNPHADIESRRALQDIIDEAAKAAVLLEEMLTLARADAAPISICRTQVDLAAVLEEVCEIARPIAKQHGLTLSQSFDRSAVLVLGDPAALKRLLWILLDNALKYSNPQGVVGVSLGSFSGQGRIVVYDNGIGISATDLPFVFDRFYRADPSRSMVEGNGLGLAIAKWIAETHQAELSVKSEQGIGTSFTILFPAPGTSTSAEIRMKDATELKQMAT